VRSADLKVSHPQIDAAELAAQMRHATAPSRMLEEVQVFQPVADESNLKDLRQHYQPGRLTLEPRFVPAKDDRYHVANLLRFDGAEFINAAYRAILKRDPDDVGVRYYLERLQQGRLDRLELILALLASEEGKRKNVRIEGLTGPLWLRRITGLPIVGSWLRYAIDFLRAPILIQRLEQLTAIGDTRDQQIANYVNLISRESAATLNDRLATVNATLEERTVAIREQISGVRRDLTQSIAEQKVATETQLRGEMDSAINRNSDATRLELRQGLAAVDAAVAEKARATALKIEELRSDINDHARDLTEARGETSRLTERLQLTTEQFRELTISTQRLRQELAIHQARLALLEQVENGLLGVGGVQPTSVTESLRHFDALYADLEDHFRGSRETVKESCEFYLPYVEALPNPALQVADIGCGRGEWLEVLRERGAKAIGVDNNRVMVESCRERSLPVVESAGLAYLRDQRDNSLRAVTAFHLIEHLPFEDLIAVLDEIMRTLQPGGIAIFETPNPDNLLVASNYFYHDPTHRNPLPSRLAKFLVESRGFARVEIINLHECAEGRFTGSDEVSVRLNELFYGPMDYAIVGWKHD